MKRERVEGGMENGVNMGVKEEVKVGTKEEVEIEVNGKVKQKRVKSELVRDFEESAVIGNAAVAIGKEGMVKVKMDRIIDGGKSEAAVASVKK